MSLPPGWIANPRPPEALTEYTGSTLATWLGGIAGAQPKTATNPAGTVGSVPAMSGAEALGALCGDPRDRS